MATAVLTTPQGLLLDFGGVIVQSERATGWQQDLGAEVHGLLVQRLGAQLAPGRRRIVGDITAGTAGAGKWRDAMSRPFAPSELGWESFWGDFVAADWPAGAREVVVRNAQELCRRLTEVKSHRVTRPGIPELLTTARHRGIPVAIVSNALSGQVHRDFLADNGLTGYVDAQIYSDEVGIRKPNPRMIELGAQAIGVPVAACWYVGDNFDRDTVCGRRAGVGANIIVEARSTYELPYDLAEHPDAVVADGHALHALFEDSLSRSGS
ncbi:HAD family hydrolase [Microbacterium protaetiae]|uniref:HAD family hydrolase n=1 Tax=Microbacterium protaetiae TaxID=2509458 RepID=A0A4P6EDQ2_9MICO|nr:HAD-IA family hydrolase [Microbacterium protaetiae]QAY59199.1 HAD family hydrolase [Microbacterium protaetiae]